MLEITKDNCLKIITELQEVSHMAPTLKNPHSSRGHTVYFCRIKMQELEDVYFIAVDLAGSEGATALGSKDEFVNGLQLAMSKGKLKLNKKQMKGFEAMYKIRFLEAACINNGLTQLQSIFGELIKNKISKSQGLGLRKVLSSFISLKSAYAILFTLSASANNNKTTRATLNFAKQTQLVKVDTQKAKKKIDKDAIINELNKLIETLRSEMDQKNQTILDLKKNIKSGVSVSVESTDNEEQKIDESMSPTQGVFQKFDELAQQISDAAEEEAKWNIDPKQLNMANMEEDDMKEIFDEFDEDGGGSIDAQELQNALHKMGQELSMEEVNEFIDEIDENNDGEIDFSEFKVMVTKTWFVDAFQAKLIQNMTKMMNTMSLMDEKDSNDNIMNEEYERLLEETKEEIIENMTSQINKLKEENNNKEKEQMNKIFELMNEIKKLMNDTQTKLKMNTVEQKQNDQDIKSMVEKIHTLLRQQPPTKLNDNVESKQQNEITVPSKSESNKKDIINDLGKEIDIINKPVLTENKNKIIEYFTSNSIDYNALKDMGRKTFMGNVSTYCENKKLQTSLGKLFKAMSNNEESKQIDNDLEKTSSIIIYLSKAIDEAKLDDNKDKIIQYFKIKQIDYNTWNDYGRKEFMTDIATHCNNKKLKSKLGKLHKALKAHIDQHNENMDENMDENNEENKQIDQDTANDNEQKSKDNELEKTSAIIIYLNKAIDEAKLSDNKDKIIQYFQIKKIDYNTWNNYGRKEFMTDVATHCNNKKLKSKLGKLHKALATHIDQHNENMDEKVAEITATAISTTDNNKNMNDNPMINMVSKTIYVLDDEKLSDNKSKIIEYFKTNDIDDNKLKDMGRKTFMGNVATYCENKKLKSPLGKLFKALTTEQPKRSSKAAFASNVIKGFSPQISEDDKPMEENKTEDNKEEYDAPEDDEEKEEEEDKVYADYENPVYREEQMPTYINRAIWYRSDDEHLERLVDQAVKKVLKLQLWNDTKFVASVYDEEKFEENINIIFQKNFTFFNKFVEKAFKRELLLADLQQEARHKEDKNKKSDDEDKQQEDEHKEMKETHVVYYGDDSESKDTDCGYHIYPMDGEFKLDDITEFAQTIDKDEVTKLSVGNKPQDFEWAVWKKKSKGDVVNISRRRRQQTFGYWEILNRENVIKNNNNVEKSKGVPINDLITMFELLRVYYTKRIFSADKNSTKSQFLKDLDDDMFRNIYCTKDTTFPKVAVDIFIHNTKQTNAHYHLTWWNCKKRTDCNAFAIKNVSAYPTGTNIKHMKEKYYMRYKINDLQNHYQPNQNVQDNGIEWFWYDNNAANYSVYSDYQTETAQKKGLLHKQIEATYQGNIDANYPWQLFDIYKNIENKSNDDQKSILSHSFNGAQLTHLKPALESKIGKIGTNGYLMRITRLSFKTAGNDKTNDTNSKHVLSSSKHQFAKPKLVSSSSSISIDVNLILNIEQIAVNSAGLFPRNIQRKNDGKNSLENQYGGSAPFVNAWLKTYYLSAKAQQKYFWSYILCICAKIKQMDIEVESQMVTISKRRHHKPQKENIFSNTSEVAQEQQDALLYDGFLVPPVLGEAVTDEITKANPTIEEIRESIEKLSKTRILSKANVDAWLVNEGDLKSVYVHGSKGNDQYLEREANLFRFAETVRKFILEHKHLKHDSSLWPYYKNYAHRNDYATYHTLVNRFNLTLMFSKTGIFQLFDENNDDELPRCFDHISCKSIHHVAGNLDSENQDKVAIRHRRKYAATLLLQQWNTLRNLNILRQQLIIIFGEIIDEGKTVVQADEKTQKFEIEQGLSQEDMIKQAKLFDHDTKNDKWKEEIEEINRKIQQHLKSKNLGWQYLSEYDLKDSDSMEISIKQHPLFESFCKRFLFQSVISERIRLTKDIKCAPWYSQFKQSWVATPKWWSTQHDTILLELALKHNIDQKEYIAELNGEKAFDFRMRLKDSADFLEFEHFCGQIANVLHRLRYITNIMVDNLNDIKPSLVDIRVPVNPDILKQNTIHSHQHGLVFSDYEQLTHLRFVKTALRQVKVYKPISENQKTVDKEKQTRYRELLDPVMKSLILDIRHTWPKGGESQYANKEEKEIELDAGTLEQTMAGSIELGELKTNQTVQISIVNDGIKNTNEENKVEEQLEYSMWDLDDESEESDENEQIEANNMDCKPKKKKKKNVSADPFVARDLEMELGEIINSFDMIKYGNYMTQLVINEIKEEVDMEELWTILSVVMEAIPFSMALEILDREMDTLKRGNPQQMEALCLEMVDGTNWRISSALRMAQYFKKIGDVDDFRENEWKQISENFEQIAHKSINSIDSDHLLYALLTIPLYDTSQPMSIIKLALEQKRVSFLNNERILTLVNHIWHHGPSIYILDDIKDVDMSFAELLPRLFFTPFRFYMSPIGYNYTLSILFLLYLGYILMYSYNIVKGSVDYYADLVLWILALGYILYEVSEWLDKGREYFSVSGLMNIWDIMISIVWIALFIINVVFIGAFNVFPKRYESIKYIIDHPETNHFPLQGVWLKVYTLLFGFQIFLISTRFLTLFQNTDYLGGLLKIVQMMMVEIVKFLSVAIVTIGAFTFGFYFIYGLENLDSEEVPDGFWATILFSFELFIGGGTNAESTVGAVFTVILTVIGMLILTNLLIALMSTEYEKFQEIAQREVSFMAIETIIDLAHRDRLFPPPLNVIVYPIGFIIHIITVLLVLFTCDCCKCSCNLYSRMSRDTYLFLNTCYCGCNKAEQLKFQTQRAATAINEEDERKIKEKLYDGYWFVLKQLTGYTWIKRKIKGEKNKKEKFKLNPLTAYHKGCYNCIKLRVNDELDGNGESTTTLRGITMKEYINKYEQIHETQLHLADTILLKHLTVDTLFCNYCYQPYVEKHVNKSLMEPFRVLLDFISCIVFLFTAWLPLVFCFVLMAIIERLQECCNDNVQSSKSDQGDKYIEFDREYFPHPESQVAAL